MAGLTVIARIIPAIATFLQDFPALLPPLPDGVACYYCLPSLPPPLLAAVACYRCFAIVACHRCLPSLLTFAYRCLILKRVFRQFQQCLLLFALTTDLPCRLPCVQCTCQLPLVACRLICYLLPAIHVRCLSVAAGGGMLIASGRLSALRSARFCKGIFCVKSARSSIHVQSER